MGASKKQVKGALVFARRRPCLALVVPTKSLTSRSRKPITKSIQIVHALFWLTQNVATHLSMAGDHGARFFKALV